MNTPEVERAAGVVQRVVDHMFSLKGKTLSVAAAEAISEAGWLRTEADRLNAELADAILAWHAKCDPRFSSNVSCAPLWGKCLAAAKAIHEHRNPKPVERYQLRIVSSGPVVMDTHEGNPIHAPGGGFTERQCIAVIAALNAEERAK